MVEMKGSEKQTITAIIPAFNEEKNIERCIKSVLWCDRVVVLWMGNDNTGKIARSLGTEVVELNKNTKPDFTSVQKNINWAIDNATTDWILRIDADEEVTLKLQKEIVTLLNGYIVNEKTMEQCSNLAILQIPVAFGIPRNQYFLGAFLKGGDWYYDRLVRLFRPESARYEPIVPVHEQFKVTGKIGYLQNRLNHYSHPTFKDAIQKFQLYTDAEVSQIKDSVWLAILKMIVLPPYLFGRWVFWHHGYRDGWRGIVASALRGWYEFLRFWKYLAHSAKT